MYDEKLFRKVATEMGLEIIEDSSVDLVNGEPSNFVEELRKHLEEMKNGGLNESKD